VLNFPDPVSSVFSPDISLLSLSLSLSLSFGCIVAGEGREAAAARRRNSRSLVGRSRSRSRFEEGEKKTRHGEQNFPSTTSSFSSFFVFSFPLFSLRDGLHDLRLRPRRPRDGHQPQDRHGAPVLLLERGEIRPCRCPPISPLWPRRRPCRARAAADAASVSSALRPLFRVGDLSLVAPTGLEIHRSYETKRTREEKKGFCIERPTHPIADVLSFLFSLLHLLNSHSTPELGGDPFSMLLDQRVIFLGGEVRRGYE